MRRETDRNRLLRVSKLTSAYESIRPRSFAPQNRRNTSERLELMKYNPYLRKHTLHRELKK